VEFVVESKLITFICHCPAANEVLHTKYMT
jgi:hypothetical protein